jgi:hypothetical protein
VAYEGVDVEAEPARHADLDRLGIPTVPAVIRGDRFVHGSSPAALAALFDVPWTEGARLAPAALAGRLERVLGVCERAVDGLPGAALALRVPGRDRTVRQLAFHVFRLSLAYRDALEARRLPQDWLTEGPPADMTDAAAICRYGRRVRAEVAAWLARPGAWDGDVETYYGRQPAAELLERTTWHAAQHVRQIQRLLEDAGRAPADRLTETDLAGLPLPRALW